MAETLKLLPCCKDDPLRFYYWPVIGKMYRQRAELCLAECAGGHRILEVGFGAGITFLNLNGIYKEIYGLDLNAPVKEIASTFKARGIKTHLRKGNALSMPYEDGFFDTVLLISILEHLKPAEQIPTFQEIRRVLKPQGQVVYGVPIERKLMKWAFWLLGCNIRKHHFSTEDEVFEAADRTLNKVQTVRMHCLFGSIYEIGHFVK